MIIGKPDLKDKICKHVEYVEHIVMDMVYIT